MLLKGDEDAEDAEAQSTEAHRSSAKRSCVTIDELSYQINAVQHIHPVHVAQVRSHLKTTGLTLGLILNFNVVHLRDGIKRVVSGYVPGTEV